MISQIIILSVVAAFAAASLPVQVIGVKAPQPYKFGYNIKDKTSQQYREETSNGAGAVKGSYGFADARGIQRQVNYVADGLGFRAQVNTNEPGTANQNPAAVQVNSNAPYAGKVVAVAPVVSKVVVPANLNNGYYNNGYYNNGYLGNGYLNNGYYNNGYLNNGYYNNGYLNNGYLNNGYYNNGYLNNGYLNNGYLSNGYLNNGYLGNGYLNNGYLNKGYYN